MKKVTAAIICAIIFALFPKEADAAYTVKKGDTLWGISKKYGMSFHDILELNLQIEFPDYINVGDKIVVRTGDTASDVVDLALSLQYVTSYQYGGQNSPFETDCSGWVQYIYSKFDVTLPRVSRYQANVGTPVTFGNLKKGDLMFFSSREDKVIDHVGIYIGGGQWISNLSSKQGVTVLSTKGNWTQKHFLWGQRVL